MPVTRPPLLTVARLALEELHVTVEVKSFELPSLYFPVAVSCCVAPMPSEVMDGVMVIELKVGAGGTTASIDNFREFEMALSVAVIVTLPLFMPVTRPPLLTVARFALEELHVAVEVKSFELPSLYFPVAVSCCFAPTFNEVMVGLIEMEVKDTAG
jgi:hypothetical protein